MSSLSSNFIISDWWPNFSNKILTYRLNANLSFTVIWILNFRALVCHFFPFSVSPKLQTLSQNTFLQFIGVWDTLHSLSPTALIYTHFTRFLPFSSEKVKIRNLLKISNLNFNWAQIRSFETASQKAFKMTQNHQRSG